MYGYNSNVLFYLLANEFVNHLSISLPEGTGKDKELEDKETLTACKRDVWEITSIRNRKAEERTAEAL